MYPFYHIALVEEGYRVGDLDIPSTLDTFEQGILEFQPHIRSNPLRQSCNSNDPENGFSHGSGRFIWERFQKQKSAKQVLATEYVMAALVFIHLANHIYTPTVIRKPSIVP